MQTTIVSPPARSEISLTVLGRSDLAKVRHHILPWLAWWVLAEILWLLFTSTVNASENVVGFGASAVAATASEVVRANRAFVFRARLRWLRTAWRVPFQIGKDTWTVFAVLALHVTHRKRVRGTWQAVPFRHGRPAGAADSGRRALATIMASMSPNSLVVGVDPDDDELLFHQLRATPEDVQRQVEPLR
jgi:multisubunit Na+/H+ antiporter MnhE subunit